MEFCWEIIAARDATRREYGDRRSLLEAFRLGEIRCGDIARFKGDTVIGRDEQQLRQWCYVDESALMDETEIANLVDPNNGIRLVPKSIDRVQADILADRIGYCLLVVFAVMGLGAAGLGGLGAACLLWYWIVRPVVRVIVKIGHKYVVPPVNVPMIPRVEWHPEHSYSSLIVGLPEDVLDMVAKGCSPRLCADIALVRGRSGSAPE